MHLYRKNVCLSGLINEEFIKSGEHGLIHAQNHGLEREFEEAQKETKRTRAAWEEYVPLSEDFSQVVAENTDAESVQSIKRNDKENVAPDKHMQNSPEYQVLKEAMDEEEAAFEELNNFFCNMMLKTRSVSPKNVVTKHVLKKRALA